jgi:hypothetical protein
MRGPIVRRCQRAAPVNLESGGLIQAREPVVVEHQHQGPTASQMRPIARKLVAYARHEGHWCAMGPQASRPTVPALDLTSGHRIRPSRRRDGCYSSASSASSSASSATMTIPSASVIFTAADTVRGVPTIGATATRMS